MIPKLWLLKVKKRMSRFLKLYLKRFRVKISKLNLVRRIARSLAAPYNVNHREVASFYWWLTTHHPSIFSPTRTCLTFMSKFGMWRENSTRWYQNLGCEGVNLIRWYRNFGCEGLNLGRWYRNLGCEGWTWADEIEIWAVKGWTWTDDIGI